MKYAIVAAGIAVIVLGCATPERVAPRVRSVKSWEPTSSHRTIELSVGWVPYEERVMRGTGGGGWNVLPMDSGGREGEMPVIVLTYPDSGNRVVLDLRMEDALLGNLLKHSLMTEVPIRRPFTDYLQEARCGSCHPADVKVKGINWQD